MMRSFQRPLFTRTKSRSSSSSSSNGGSGGVLSSVGLSSPFSGGLQPAHRLRTMTFIFLVCSLVSLWIAIVRWVVVNPETQAAFGPGSSVSQRVQPKEPPPQSAQSINAVTQSGSQSSNSNTDSNVISGSSVSFPSTRACKILRARGPDPYAGLGTLIFLYPINFILTAQQRGEYLWIDYDPSYSDKFYDESHGPNMWEYFMKPLTPPHECNFWQSEMHSLSKKEVFPGIHYLADYAVRAWYYGDIERRRFQGKFDTYDEPWYRRHRRVGSQVVRSHFIYKDLVNERVQRIIDQHFPEKSQWQQNSVDDDDDGSGDQNDGRSEESEGRLNDGGLLVLGVHMRGTDKAAHRRNIPPQMYTEYIRAFFDYHQCLQSNMAADQQPNNVDDGGPPPRHRCRVLVATDDSRYLDQLLQQLRSIDPRMADSVVTQSGITRSDSKTAVFELKNVSKFDIGLEVLTDILLLARLSDWFIHSASAVSESVFYNNFRLHSHSIHLEYTKQRQTPKWAANVPIH